MTGKNKPEKRSNKVRQDLLLILGIGIVVLAIAVYLDLFELIIDWVEHHEGWELDDILLAVFLSFGGWVIFAMRRWKELQSEIADHRMTEARLYKSESDYRGIFEQAHDAILIFRPEDEVVIQANQRACDIYGFSLDELQGMSLKSISKDKEYGDSRIQETLHKGTYYQFETTQYRKDGSEMDLEINAAVVDYQGEKAILSVNRDVTERKTAEQKILQETKFRQALLELTNSLGTQLNPSDVMRILTQTARSLFETDLTHLWVLDQDKHQLELMFGDERTASQLETGSKIALDDPISVVARVARNLRGEVHNNILMRAEDDSSEEVLNMELAQRSHLQAALAVPLIQKEQLLGVLVIGSQTEFDRFSDEDMEKAHLLAAQTGQALWRAQLFDDGKKAEVSLRKSESFNRGVLRALDENIAVLDCQGQIIKTNRAWDRFAIENSALTDRYYLGENYLAVCEQAAQQGNILAEKAFFGIKAVINGYLRNFTLEYPCHSPTEKRWFFMQATPMADDSGMVVVAHKNVTDLKHAQSKAEERRRFLRQVIDTTPNLIFIRDAEGRFTLVNQAVAKRFDKDAAELVGKTEYEFNSNTNQVDRFMEHDRLVLSSLQPQVIPAEEVTLESGDIRWFKTIKAPIESVDGGLQVLGVVTDITELKLAEEEQRKLNTSLKQHSERQGALLSISNALARELDLHKLYWIIFHEIAQSLLHASHLVIKYLNEEEFLECGFAIVDGKEIDVNEFSLKPLGKEDPWSQAILKRKPVIIDIKSFGLFMESRGHAPNNIGEVDRCPQSGIYIPLIGATDVFGVMCIQSYEKDAFDKTDSQFLSLVAGYASEALKNAKLFADLQQSTSQLAQSYDITLEGWVQALDLRDETTEGHTRRVTEMTVHLAQKLDVCEEELPHIRRGALLHDIGKMGIPDSILLKPGKLTDEEWAVMKEHPVYAYEWLKDTEYLKPAMDIPYCHHENWDGTGYPRGLKGEEIPLAARIFAVVDVWDALRSDRPYRKAWPEEQVRNHIRQGAGTHFDPQVVDVFLSLPLEELQ